MSLEEKVEHLSYQMKILLEIVDWTERPFEYEVIRANLTKQDVEAFYQLLEDIRVRQNEQMRYGFTSIEPLLVHFVGMLDSRLDVKTILGACVRQGIELDVTEPLYRQVRLLG
ncbi:DUF1878 family protein [Exiguobacterium sp. MMG028]|uniref:DUF1878 family protein n=1 Tax=Exiguobacterium sp. MMG028 TaxID=3021979 RepID=UPI0022FE34CF|nr:DUF1878 family protein [Exiguobacterium sp. MMG028]MDA5560491.1 DUF1878 family protein [Exiguobacterium sp. MMG028]